MAKHSRFSPSASERWMSCPGSLSLSDGLPKAPSSAYADEGTAAHGVLAHFLETGELLAGFEVSGEWWETTEEMKEAIDVVNVYLENDGFDDLHLEQSVCASSIHPDLWGSADIVKLDTVVGELEIIDFKYGAGVAVNAWRNPQLAIYALGVLDTIIKNDDLVWTIKCTIIQPRASHAAGPIRSYDWTIEELREFGAEVENAIELTKSNEPILAAGDHCQWCPVGAANKCPVQEQAALDMFEVIEENKGTPDLNDLERLSAYMQMVPHLEMFCKNVRAAAEAEIKAGNRVNGWKLIEGRKTLQWKDKNDAEAAFTKVAKAWNKTLRTPTQLSKELPKLKDKIDELAVRKTGTVKLAPLSDPAPAIEFGQMFEDLTG